MLRKAIWFVLLLAFSAVSTWAEPVLQDKEGNLISLPSFDAFADTLAYDDGVMAWWYGGLPSFRLATRFTPVAEFELQRVLVSLSGSSTTPIGLWLKADSSGLPGAMLWSGTLLYNASQTWLGVTLDTIGGYTFSAGSDFWVELYSAGPPYEIYDASQVQPPHSLTKFSGSSNWVNSPGDNFIRVVGEYSSAIIDVGIDSIFHGGHYFNPQDGSNFDLSCMVTNYSDSALLISIACSLYTEIYDSLNDTTYYEFHSALLPQNAMLDSAQTLRFDFEVDSLDSGRYLAPITVVFSGDHDPSNNVRAIEFQIYSPPAQLRYDDGIYLGAAITSSTGKVWAMKFNPWLQLPFEIQEISVAVTPRNGDLAVRIQILNADGVSGAPGTVLWDTLRTLSSGWNTFPVSLMDSGAFYIAYVFENGYRTPALRFDGAPSSNQAWEKNQGVWSPDPRVEDWCMRATVSVEGGLWMEMTPTSALVIPRLGGEVEFDLDYGNSGFAPELVDLWLDYMRPDSTVILITGVSQGMTLPPGHSTVRSYEIPISHSKPAGTYLVNSYLGDYNPPNNVIYVEDHFDFWKADTGTIYMDVNLAGLWHSDKYFLPLGSGITLKCQLTNYSDSLANCSVTCSLFTEVYDSLMGTVAYAFFQAQPPQNVLLDLEESVNLNFPIDSLDANRYQT
ncbi:MAG: hypothetical protein ABH878_04045, partial [bacterium]